MNGHARRHRIALASSLLLLAWGAAMAGADTATDLEAVRSLQDRERWAASESLATIVLVRLEGEPKPDSLNIAEALYRTGIARWRTVGYADGTGLSAATRSLGIRERRLAADHLDVADGHALVARFLPEVGRPDSAIAHVRRALAIREGRLAPDDTLIARTWDQLALIQRNSGDMPGALDSWTRAIEIRTRFHGPEHPEVARLLAQTGVPHMELGDIEKAREVLEGSLRMFARTAGPDSPGRWIPLNILADVEKRSGNVARNIDLLQEALRVVHLAYGANSREALTLRSNLAIALYELQDAAGSRALYVDLLPQTEAQYGSAHFRTLRIRHGLAMCSRDLGDYVTGLALLGSVDSAFSASPNPPAHYLATIQSQRADLLYWEGRFLESRAVAERALLTASAATSRKGEALATPYVALIPTLVAIGDTAALDRAYRGLLEVNRQHAMGPTEVGPMIQLNAAWAARHLGRETEAWTHALEAERIAREQLHLNLQSLPDRRALMLGRTEGRHLDMVLDRTRGADASRRETAWDRLVRNRGLIRAEIERRQRPRGFESDSALVGLHARWMAAQRLWARRLVSMGGAARDSAGRAALEDLRARAEASESAYARALAERGSQVPAAEIGLAEVRSRLVPGQALVGCVESHGTLERGDSAFVVAFVARGGSESVELIELGPSSDLRAAIDPWRAQLAVSPGPGAGRGAERASRRLGRTARAATWDRVAPH